jgi:hypothetical protein
MLTSQLPIAAIVELPGGRDKYFHGLIFTRKQPITRDGSLLGPRTAGRFGRLGFTTSPAPADVAAGWRRSASGVSSASSAVRAQGTETWAT